MNNTKINYNALKSANKPFYSLAEFADMIGCTLEYARAMCRGYTDPRGYKSKLPDGWQAIKNTETHMWEISKISTTPSMEKTPTIETKASPEPSGDINNLMMRVAELEGFKQGVMFVISSLNRA